MTKLYMLLGKIRLHIFLQKWPLWGGVQGLKTHCCTFQNWEGEKVLAYKINFPFTEPYAFCENGIFLALI